MATAVAAGRGASMSPSGSPGRRQGGLLRASAVFGSMTLLSRIAGLVRDMLQAALFGASAAMDAFLIAYRIPNLLRRIFAEGSFAQAFVPVYSELRQKGDAAALREFLDHVAGALCAAVLLVTALSMLLAPWLAELFVLGAPVAPGKEALLATMLRITFPYLVFISLTSLAGAVLNSHERFALPALTPVLHNLAVIAAMLALAPVFEVKPMALAWGVLAAGLLQFALLWPALGRMGLRPRFRLRLRHPMVRRVGALMLPTLFSSSVAQINLLVGTMFAAWLATGSQSWLYLAERLAEFPLGLFGVAIGTVILPHLARRHADTDAEGYSAALDWGLRSVLLVALPAGLGLGLLAEPITATVYQYGRFTAFDTRMAAWALTAMSLGVPAFMLSKVLAPAFYARQDTRTPMRVAIVTVLTNLLLTVAIVTPLWLNRVEGGHVGIALATSLAGLVNAGLLWRALRRAGLHRPRPGWIAYLLRLALACLALAAVVLWLRHTAGDWSQMRPTPRLLWLGLTIGAGALSYGAALLLGGWRPSALRAHGA
jgi:putative peptidoglycan lipid II flippase